MSHDFIEDLRHALNRVVTADISKLKEILIISGMPEETENLRYMSFNRQIITEENRTMEFSAVAVINNRRAVHWRLEGYKKKISYDRFQSQVGPKSFGPFSEQHKMQPRDNGYIDLSNRELYTAGNSTVAGNARRQNFQA